MSDGWREPTDEEIDRAAGWIIDGEAVGRLGTEVTEVFEVAEAGQLPESKLKVLFDYWRDLCRRHGQPPAREQVDVLDVLPAAGNIMLLDVVREGFDARYRVYGTGIANHAGRDWTGASVSEMNAVTRTSLALMYRACYRAVYRSRIALYTQHNSPLWLSAKSWRRLILPLLDANAACSGFLVGNVPVDIKYLDRRTLELQRTILGVDGT